MQINRRKPLSQLFPKILKFQSLRQKSKHLVIQRNPPLQLQQQQPQQPQ